MLTSSLLITASSNRNADVIIPIALQLVLIVPAGPTYLSSWFIFSLAFQLVLIVAAAPLPLLVSVPASSTLMFQLVQACAPAGTVAPADPSSP
ncbi:hypothetical protein F511_24488 [Dorcoceras hygrometricum]|uniref:Uncharacterized protein n=1 Tax=Dorcoceras hygrometricum TaxID=472368 RepID=A0A2Z7C8H4_9LAMI|nr:hypothetical protein F511_24488 [Dorcoceras hygrometricum]